MYVYVNVYACCSFTDNGDIVLMQYSVNNLASPLVNRKLASTIEVSNESFRSSSSESATIATTVLVVLAVVAAALFSAKKYWSFSSNGKAEIV